MNIQLFAAVPAWVSTLALVVSIALPTTMWHTFERSGSDARIDGARTMSIWLAVVLFLWVTAAVLLSLLGFFEADPLARLSNIAYTFVPLLAGVILWPCSRIFRATLRAVHPNWIIRIQFYRILGISYLVSWRYGLMPAVFSIPAGVGDSIVGFSALLVAWMVYRRRSGAGSAAKLWNTFGLIDIATAVTLGALTTPGPFHVLAMDAQYVLITTFPMVLLPTIIVPLSILCHLYSLLAGTGGEIRTGYKTA